MKLDVLLDMLKGDFEFISSEVEGILLYGSYAKDTADKRSDIDICIVKPRRREVLTRIFAKFGSKYDVKIFEGLPLYIKIDVIGNHKVIYGSEPEISYYLYHFRKEWEDMRYRIMSNRFRTASEMADARRKWLDTRRQIPIKA